MVWNKTILPTKGRSQSAEPVTDSMCSHPL
jgi:hypothetical protein